MRSRPRRTAAAGTARSAARRGGRIPAAARCSRPARARSRRRGSRRRSRRTGRDRRARARRLEHGDRHADASQRLGHPVGRAADVARRERSRAAPAAPPGSRPRPGREAIAVGCGDSRRSACRPRTRGPALSRATARSSDALRRRRRRPHQERERLALVLARQAERSRRHGGPPGGQRQTHGAGGGVAGTVRQRHGESAGLALPAARSRRRDRCLVRLAAPR